MNTEIIDQATATAALNAARDHLAKATGDATNTTAALRDAIVRIRPMGPLTVDEMAEAIGRNRNYVDTIWSGFGDTTKGKQTRVAVEASDDERKALVDQLYDVARNQRGTAATVLVLRAERDRVIAMVYASKILGPSAIAAAVGVDRNHVLRVARKAGVAPAWRPAGSARNQHNKAA